MYRRAVEIAVSGLVAVLTLTGLSLCLPSNFSQAKGPDAQKPAEIRTKSDTLPTVSGHPNIKFHRKVVRLPIPTAGYSGELTMQPNVEYEAGHQPAFEVVPGIQLNGFTKNGIETNNAKQPANQPIFNRFGTYLKDHNPMASSRQIHSQNQPSFLETIQNAIVGKETFTPVQTSVGGKSILVNSQQQVQHFEEVSPGVDNIPVPLELDKNHQPSEDIFAELIEETIEENASYSDRCSWLGRLFSFGPGAAKDEIGIGHQRVMFAPFEIEYSQPMNNYRFRFDSAYRFRQPDRAEYLWAKSGALGGLGPTILEESVDYQDLRFSFETGGEIMSVITELPIRSVDPVINPNTTGLGDMSVATKVVLINGKRWQITQIFRTFIKTGSSRHGGSTGHVSLEPGFLVRRKYTDQTYFHSELKYRIPIGGHPTASGQVLKYALGVSHILYESDSLAFIPTLEMVGWTILDGQGSSFPTGIPVNLDSQAIFNIHPGLRMVMDTGGDLGLFEIGISGGFAASVDRWYDGQFTLEARWSY